MALALLSVALLLATRFYPRVEQVTVVGNRRFDPAAILRLANVAPGDPLLWVTRARVSRLVQDPWISGARVIRRWPHEVTVMVWERTPLLTDGETVWAHDGTVLPGVGSAARAALPRLEGWGEPRLSEALALADLLAPLSPKVISYSPEGFDIELADTTLFTPDVATLQRHWAAWSGQLGSRAAVYPWGVSDNND